MKFNYPFLLCAISGLSLMACAQTAPSSAPMEKTAEQKVSTIAPEKTTNITPELKTSSAKDTEPMNYPDNPTNKPPLTAAQLRESILKLITSLVSREDTNQANLEKIMEVKLLEDDGSDGRFSMRGDVKEGWGYWYFVRKMDVEPASVINFYFFHGEKPLDDALPKTCTLDFEAFANQLVALGYEPGTRPILREWGFGKEMFATKTGIGIGIKFYQVESGAENGADCIESIHIGSRALK